MILLSILMWLQTYIDTIEYYETTMEISEQELYQAMEESYQKDLSTNN